MAKKEKVVFVSPYARYGVSALGEIRRFDRGIFESEDPELIEAMHKSSQFNLDFFEMGKPPAAMAAEMAARNPSAIPCPLPGCPYVVPEGENPAEALIKHMAEHAPKAEQIEKKEKAEK